MVPWYHCAIVPFYHGNHQSSIINSQSSIINYQSSITNHQSSIIDHQSSTIHHQPSINSHQSSRYQIMAQMLFGRFWLQNKDLSPSVGAIDIIFRAGSVPMGPGVWGVGRDAPHWKFRAGGFQGGREAKPPLPPRWAPAVALGGGRAGII